MAQLQFMPFNWQLCVSQTNKMKSHGIAGDIIRAMQRTIDGIAPMNDLLKSFDCVEQEHNIANIRK